MLDPRAMGPQSRRGPTPPPPDPSENAREPDRSEDRAEHEACGDLSPDHSPPVSQANLAERHGSNHERGGLRARISAAADDQRNEQCEYHRALDLLLEISHG